MIEKMNEAVEYIRQRYAEPAGLGLILGSGLGAFAEAVQGAVRIPFGDIPHFPVSSVAGHAGTLIMGRLHGRSVAVMQGRVHYYEGYSPDEVIFPARVLHGLGLMTLVVGISIGKLI